MACRVAILSWVCRKIIFTIFQQLDALETRLNGTFRAIQFYLSPPAPPKVNSKGQLLGDEHISDKTNQFITVASDGQCLIWDTRYQVRVPCVLCVPYRTSPICTCAPRSGFAGLATTLGGIVPFALFPPANRITRLRSTMTREIHTVQDVEQPTSAIIFLQVGSRNMIRCTLPVV